MNGGRFPLFTVELKVTEGTTADPAKFTYSASAESLHNSVMSHYNNSFELLKGTVRVRAAVNPSLYLSIHFCHFSFISFSCISSHAHQIFSLPSTLRKIVSNPFIHASITTFCLHDRYCENRKENYEEFVLGKQSHYTSKYFPLFFRKNIS